MKKIFVGLVLCVILTAFAVALELDVWLTGFTNEQMRIISDITESQFTAQTGIHVNYVVFTVADIDVSALGGVSGQSAAHPKRFVVGMGKDSHQSEFFHGILAFPVVSDVF